MTDKRFEIIDEQFISYYGGTGYLISNGECKFWLWHNKEESQKVCDKLNELHEGSQNKQKLLHLATNKIENLLEENNQLKHRLAISEKAKYVTTLEKENEQLKQQLFETRKDYILETYADNPVRRDEKLKELEKGLEE